MIEPERIARVCHEANRAFCGPHDASQVPWDVAPEWQRESAVSGVAFVQSNPNSPPSASHDNWLAEKRAAGWSYGSVKDADAKQHPCFVPYDELPEDQKRKDVLFQSIVKALS